MQEARVSCAERIDYVLQRIGMKKYKKRRADNLSGGQRQRVAIARALVKSPDVIFADEPTGNLDERTTMMVMNLLKKISSECLVILATHERRIAEFFADRIISVSDGKIISDETLDGSGSYRAFDDGKIYLGELRHDEMSCESAHIDLYGADCDAPITLRVVYNAGRLYVEAAGSTSGDGAADGKIRIETTGASGNSGIELEEGVRPDVTMGDMERLSYDLPRLPARGSGKLSYKSVHSMASGLISTMGRRLVIPVIAIILTAILAVIAAADYVTLLSLDPKPYIAADERTLSIKVEKSDFITYWDLHEGGAKLISMLRDEFPDSEIIPQITYEPSYAYKGFYQMEGLRDIFDCFSYMPIEYLDAADIIYGRMPQNPDEIVIDRWVVENFMTRETMLARSITAVQNLLGEQVRIAPDKSVTVCGISDSKNPSIYADNFMFFGCAVYGTPAASLETLQRLYPGEYDDVTLAADECLLCERETFVINDQYKLQTSDYFNITGRFKECYGATLVFSEAGFARYADLIAEEYGTYTVIGDESAEIKEWIASLQGFDSINISVIDTYGEGKLAYDTARSVRLDARLIVTIMISLMSIAILCVAMKSNAVKFMDSIIVYRLLGIGKSSIESIFALQALMLTVFATLPASVLTALVIVFLNGVAGLGVKLIITLPVLIFTIAALTLINVLTSVAAISPFMHKAPAKLAAKYDV